MLMQVGVRAVKSMPRSVQGGGYFLRASKLASLGVGGLLGGVSLLWAVFN